jgi:hypothetical protein
MKVKGSDPSQEVKIRVTCYAPLTVELRINASTRVTEHWLQCRGPLSILFAVIIARVGRLWWVSHMSRHHAHHMGKTCHTLIGDTLYSGTV